MNKAGAYAEEEEELPPAAAAAAAEGGAPPGGPVEMTEEEAAMVAEAQAAAGQPLPPPPSAVSAAGPGGGRLEGGWRSGAWQGKLDWGVGCLSNWKHGDGAGSHKGAGCGKLQLCAVPPPRQRIPACADLSACRPARPQPPGAAAAGDEDMDMELVREAGHVFFRGECVCGVWCGLGVGVCME